MHKLKRIWGSLNIPSQLVTAKTVKSALTGNSGFKNPNPSLSDFGVGIDDAEVAYENSLNGGRLERAILRAKMKVLTNMMNAITAYVTLTADGDEALINSAGFGVVSSNPRTPRTLSVSQGPHSGMITVTCVAVANASYRIQIATEPPTNENVWRDLIETTKSRVSCNSITPETRCWIRTKTVSSKGVTDWTEPISILVL